MCKRKLGIFLVLASCACFICQAHAACDYETQNKIKNEAANVKVVNEMRTTVFDYDGNEKLDMSPDDVDFEDSFYIGDKAVISIMNITEDLYFTVKNQKGFEKKVTYSETDNGTLEFELLDLNDITPYQFIIYSNHDGCMGTELRKIEIVIPMYNPYSESIACDGLNDYYYCQKYITEAFKESYETINNKIFEKYKEVRNEVSNEEVKEKTFWNKINDFLKNNVFLVIIVVAIIAGGAIAVWYIKKRRSEII